MLPQLTLDKLVHSAYDFCEQQNGLNHVELLGVTDGKAIGTSPTYKSTIRLRSAIAPWILTCLALIL